MVSVGADRAPQWFPSGISSTISLKLSKDDSATKVQREFRRNKIAMEEGRVSYLGK